MAEEQCVLEGELLKNSLSSISRTVDGMGYAFTKLECVGQGVSSLPEEMGNFTHLRFVDLRDNALTDVANICSLPHVLSLNLSGNALTVDGVRCFEESCLPYCQFLDVSRNQLETARPLAIERLERVSFDENQISSFEEFGGHAHLEELISANNKLTSCGGLTNMPVLRRLDLSKNEIENLEGLMDLPELKELNLRSNKIAVLTELSTLPSLQSLDLQANQIAELTELSKLNDLPALIAIDARGNPMCEDPDQFVVEALIILPKLKKINGVEVTAEHLESAKELKLQRIREQEEEEAKRAETEQEES